MKEGNIENLITDKNIRMKENCKWLLFNAQKLWFIEKMIQTESKLGNKKLNGSRIWTGQKKHPQNDKMIL